jgi:hypothetical protein
MFAVFPAPLKWTVGNALDGSNRIPGLPVRKYCGKYSGFLSLASPQSTEYGKADVVCDTSGSPNSNVRLANQAVE